MGVFQVAFIEPAVEKLEVNPAVYLGTNCVALAPIPARGFFHIHTCTITMSHSLLVEDLAHAALVRSSWCPAFSVGLLIPIHGAY